jgi:hypothetical protein
MQLIVSYEKTILVTRYALPIFSIKFSLESESLLTLK